MPCNSIRVLRGGFPFIVFRRLSTQMLSVIKLIVGAIKIHFVARVSFPFTMEAVLGDAGSKFTYVLHLRNARLVTTQSDMYRYQSTYYVGLKRNLFYKIIFRSESLFTVG